MPKYPFEFQSTGEEWLDDYFSSLRVRKLWDTIGGFNRFHRHYNSLIYKITQEINSISKSNKYIFEAFHKNYEDWKSGGFLYRKTHSKPYDSDVSINYLRIQGLSNLRRRVLSYYKEQISLMTLQPEKFAGHSIVFEKGIYDPRPWGSSEYVRHFRRFGFTSNKYAVEESHRLALEHLATHGYADFMGQTKLLEGKLPILRYKLDADTLQQSAEDFFSDVDTVGQTFVEEIKDAPTRGTMGMLALAPPVVAGQAALALVEKPTQVMVALAPRVAKLAALPAVVPIRLAAVTARKVFGALGWWDQHFGPEVKDITVATLSSAGTQMLLHAKPLINEHSYRAPTWKEFWLQGFPSQIPLSTQDWRITPLRRGFADNVRANLLRRAGAEAGMQNMLSNVGGTMIGEGVIGSISRHAIDPFNAPQTEANIMDVSREIARAYNFYNQKYAGPKALSLMLHAERNPDVDEDAIVGAAIRRAYIPQSNSQLVSRGFGSILWTLWTWYLYTPVHYLFFYILSRSIRSIPLAGRLLPESQMSPNSGLSRALSPFTFTTSMWAFDKVYPVVEPAVSTAAGIVTDIPRSVAAAGRYMIDKVSSYWRPDGQEEEDFETFMSRLSGKGKGFKWQYLAAGAAACVLLIAVFSSGGKR